MNEQQTSAAGAVDYSHPLNRALYDSPLHTRRGKLALVAVAAIMLYAGMADRSDRGMRHTNWNLGASEK